MSEKIKANNIILENLPTDIKNAYLEKDKEIISLEDKVEKTKKELIEWSSKKSIPSAWDSFNKTFKGYTVRTRHTENKEEYTRIVNTLLNYDDELFSIGYGAWLRKAQLVDFLETGKLSNESNSYPVGEIVDSNGNVVFTTLTVVGYGNGKNAPNRRVAELFVFSRNKELIKEIREIEKYNEKIGEMNSDSIKKNKIVYDKIDDIKTIINKTEIIYNFDSTEDGLYIKVNGIVYKIFHNEILGLVNREIEFTKKKELNLLNMNFNYSDRLVGYDIFEWINKHKANVYYLGIDNTSDGYYWENIYIAHSGNKIIAFSICDSSWSYTTGISNSFDKVFLISALEHISNEDIKSENILNEAFGKREVFSIISSDRVRKCEVIEIELDGDIISTLESKNIFLNK